MTEVFCDFDGTITNRDSIVFLTEVFGAGGEFRDSMLQKIKSGELSVFEVIRRELETVKISWPDAVDALKKNIRVDPTFGAFVNWCRVQSLPLTVVSSGMIPVVSLFVSEFGVPFFAHPVKVSPAGWQYRRDAWADKENVLGQSTAENLIYIGDGTSDVSAIPFADVLFAKSYLADYCDDHDIPYHRFENFESVRLTMESWLANSNQS